MPCREIDKNPSLSFDYTCRGNSIALISDGSQGYGHGNIGGLAALLKLEAKKENTMAKKEKRLCKWKEDDIFDKFDKFITIVSSPKFVCKKCGRVADKKKWLHKPVSLE